MRFFTWHKYAREIKLLRLWLFCQIMFTKKINIFANFQIIRIIFLWNTNKRFYHNHIPFFQFFKFDTSIVKIYLFYRLNLQDCISKNPAASQTYTRLIIFLTLVQFKLHIITFYVHYQKNLIYQFKQLARLP